MIDLPGLVYGISLQPAAKVPEPGILVLLGAGLIALVVWSILKRKRSSKKGKDFS